MSNIALNTLKCQEFLKVSNKFQIEMINYFIRSTDRYENVYPSVKTIAEEVGCSERSFYNHFPVLEKMGIVKHVYDHRRSSTYQLNALLFTHINVFKDKFKALKKIIHKSIKFPKVSAIQRCLKRCFKFDVLTQFLGSICRPYKKTLTSLKETSLSLFTRAREIVLPVQERQEFKLKIKFRRERKMERVEISRTLKKVTEKLSLTKWGQIKLIQFPDGALEHALQSYTKITTFNTFFMKALDWCKEQAIEPDWAYHYNLSERYNMPKDAKFMCKRSPEPTTFQVKEIPKQSAQYHFEKSRRERQERMKGDKEYQGRVNFYQQFKPKFLEEEECDTNS